jgi:hypothetical protein
VALLRITDATFRLRKAHPYELTSRSAVVTSIRSAFGARCHLHHGSRQIALVVQATASGELLARPGRLHLFRG